VNFLCLRQAVVIAPSGLIVTGQCAKVMEKMQRIGQPLPARRAAWRRKKRLPFAGALVPVRHFRDLDGGQMMQATY
jgi:hypothetical protein